MTITIKICTRCKTGYPATLKYFQPCKRGKNGLRVWCRQCCNSYQQEYRQTNKGKCASQKYTLRYRQSRVKFFQRYNNTIRGHLIKIFAGMKHRCNNPKYLRYKDWGGRGIELKFSSSNEFVNYVMNILKVDPRGLQIDRIDNNGHYEPGNIRFITAKINANNRRDNVKHH